MENPLSYCRFSDADIYLFQHAQGGWECCACSCNYAKIGDRRWPPGPKRLKTIFGVLLHCLRHSLKKDYVPGDVYGQLLKEMLRGQWTIPALPKESFYSSREEDAKD